MKTTKLLAVAVSVLVSMCGYSQCLVVEWQKSLGGSYVEFATAIQEISDGGFIVIGSSDSDDGDITSNYFLHDWWVVRLDVLGNIIWQRSLGGSGAERAYSVDETSDGGFIIAGYSNSNDHDVIVNLGMRDIWVVKLSDNGEMLWQRSLGGASSETASSIQETSDGGFILAGTTNSINGDVTQNHGGEDYWVVKLDNGGELAWERSLGGSGADNAYSIQETSDGGFVVAGSSSSVNGDVTDNHGDRDFWVVKLDSLGNQVWQRSLGGSGWDEALSIQETSDGGFIVAGFSDSIDGDVTGNHGFMEYWVVKLDDGGGLRWQKCLGGSGSDIATSIDETNDGGFVVVGHSVSNDGDVSVNYGGSDYWVVKIDSNGELLCERSLGGGDQDIAKSIQKTNDGGFIVAGNSDSFNGDVTDNHGYGDFWVVKFSSAVSISTVDLHEFSVYPNPSNDWVNIELSNFQDASVSVVDAVGRVVVWEKFIAKQHLLDLTVLPDGVYLIRVQTISAVYSQKLILE